MTIELIEPDKAGDLLTLRLQPTDSSSSPYAGIQAKSAQTAGPGNSPPVQPESFQAGDLTDPIPSRPIFFSSADKQAQAVIKASAQVSTDAVSKLKQAADEAIAYFQQHYGPVSRPINFAIGEQTQALRTGYSFEEQSINLPNLQEVKNCGLDSIDVIRHEIFHALMHQAYPQYCSPEKRADPKCESLHEALADYFTYKQHPDESFGEDYYKDRPQMRSYLNDLHLNLTAGAHGQGNAITKLMIESGVTEKDVRTFLEKGNFSLEGLAQVAPVFAQNLLQDKAMAIKQEVKAYPQAPQDRYWLKPNLSLELGFIANEKLSEEHPNFHIAWLDKSGNPSQSYTFQESSPNNFIISGNPGAKIEKVIARFLDGDKIIGFRPFYFGVRD